VKHRIKLEKVGSKNVLTHTEPTMGPVIVKLGWFEKAGLMPVRELHA
jgi:hypothetical protein